MNDLNHYPHLASRTRSRCYLALSMLGVLLTARARAQTFTTLHSFTGDDDGAKPYAALILSGNTLYGTASQGGGSTIGTVFAVNTDGTGFRTLHTFGQPDGGGEPFGGLILSSNTLYGAAVGAVFSVNTNGTGFTILTNLPSFTDGSFSPSGLLLSGGTLYGTGVGRGDFLADYVFKVNTDGTGLTKLSTFGGGGSGSYGTLLLSGDTLYGAIDYPECLVCKRVSPA
jgi:uncharacterized repeat protein (TIGR03803 family)